MLDLFLMTIETLSNQNDHDFLLQLYYSYRKMVFSTALEITRNPEDAEDLTQDVFLKLIPRTAALREKENRRQISYIYAMTKNTAFEFLTHKGIVNQHTIDDQDGTILDNYDSGICIEDCIIQKEQLESLIKIWPLLSNRDRYLLRARYILHQDDAEIGKGLNVKPDSIRTLIMRARKKALTLMQQHNVI